MEKKIIITALLIALLSVVFSMSGDGKNVPVVKEETGVVKVQETQETVQIKTQIGSKEADHNVLNENVTEDSQVKIDAHIYPIKQRNSLSESISLDSLCTFELINRFLNDYMLSAYLGLLQEYDDKVHAILRNDVIKELLERKNCINCVIKVYKDKINTNEVLHKELLLLLISSKEFIGKMQNGEKYEIVKISYDTYLKDYNNKQISNGRTFSYPILFLFTNILEDVGFDIIPDDISWEQEHNYLFQKEWIGKLVIKTQEYLGSKGDE